MGRVSLAQMRDNIGPRPDVNDLIERAQSIGHKLSLERPNQVITNGEAREFATDCVVEVIQGVFAQVDARAIVDADERLAHLTDENKQIVADLIDRCKATIDCDYDWEEDPDDGDEEDPGGPEV